MIVAASLGLLPFLADPITRSPRELRRLDCERVTIEEASAERPGAYPPEKPRGDYLERSVLHCRELIAAPGLRLRQDDALLRELDATVATLVEAATGWGPLTDRTWLVEATLPTASMIPKVTFAAKTALMQQGMRVSDRTPTLGAGDVDVITRMPPMDAYPAACRRFADTGSLRADDVLLYTMVLDPRETMLHAGLCIEGGWTWLR